MKMKQSYYDPDLVCSKCLTNDQVFYNGAIWHGEEHFEVSDSWCSKCEDEAHMIQTAPEDIRYLVQYMVVWCVRYHKTDRELLEDKYEVFDDLASAKERYAEILKNPDTFSASICVPVESTDYPSPRAQEINALLTIGGKN